MTIRNLTHLTAPKSVALIGASPQPGSVGLTVTRNLLSGSFAGDISLINPKYSAIEGRRCFASVNDLPEAPDLAVIATPPAAVPALDRRSRPQGNACRSRPDRRSWFAVAGHARGGPPVLFAHPRTKLHRANDPTRRPQCQLRASRAAGRRSGIRLPVRSANHRGHRLGRGA